MSRLDDILHHHEVSRRLHSSGQPTAEELPVIADAGFTAVINLAMNHSDGALPQEGQWLNKLGLAYAQVPVPFEAPTTAHLQAFFGLMQAWAGERVWVHCALNYRASVFLYLHARQVEQASHEQAQAAMWPYWQPDDCWERFIHQQLQN